MEGELNNFMMVWFSVLASLSYCYGITKVVPIGTPRMFFIFPIIILFFLLPLNLSTIHLGGGTAFFITWLGSFKLWLLIFGEGPLALDPSSTSLGKFLAIACLPIEIEQPETNKNGQFQKHPPQNSHPNGQNRANPIPKPIQRPEKTKLSPDPKQNGKIKENPHQKSGPKSSLLAYAMKISILTILVQVLQYKHHFHKRLILALNCLLIYILLELLLSTVALMVKSLMGFEIQPHFNDPPLSTSLQDFWGRRWNLMVSKTLRTAVHEPIVEFSERLVGRRWASIPGVVGSFAVSGLMHELIFYYMGRVRPTWEVTWFFVLHGLCLTAEIVLKKTMKKKMAGREMVTGSWRLPRVVSTALTLGFLMETCYWLFFPQFIRCKADVRIVQEYADFGAFFKTIGHSIRRSVFD